MKHLFFLILSSSAVAVVACSMPPCECDCAWEIPSTTTSSLSSVSTSDACTCSSSSSSSSSTTSASSSGVGGQGVSCAFDQGDYGGEAFSCEYDSSNHFVIHVEDIEDTGSFFMAADGSIDYPDSSPQTDIPWQVIYVDQYQNSSAKLDLGELPSGTLIETNWGLTENPSLCRNKPAVDPEYEFCYFHVCPHVGILGCYGTTEIGRVDGMDGMTVTGSVLWGGTDQGNVIFVAP